MSYDRPMAFDADAFTQQARQSWNQVAARYSDLSAGRFVPIAEAFVAFSGLAPGQDVLDVACGPGTAAFAAARAVGKSGRVTGADLSPGMLQEAGARARRQDLTISFLESNVESLPFPDGSFDAVISQLGLMLFPRPDAALREMARVAKPGGTVACLVQGRKEKMLATSLVMSALLKHAPEIKEEGAPNLYAFAPEGMMEKAFETARLRPESRRVLSGTLDFPSAGDFWKTMTEASGRTGAILRSLPPESQRAVEDEVVARAEKFKTPAGVGIPYEMVMARARKP